MLIDVSKSVENRRGCAEKKKGRRSEGRHERGGGVQ